MLEHEDGLEEPRDARCPLEVPDVGLHRRTLERRSGHHMNVRCSQIGLKIDGVTIPVSRTEKTKCLNFFGTFERLWWFGGSYIERSDVCVFGWLIN